MYSDVLAKRKQTHPLPRRDGESSVVAFDTLELAASFYCLLGGSIDTSGVLAEVESGFTHNSENYNNAIASPIAKATITPPMTQKSHLLDFPLFFG